MRTLQQAEAECSLFHYEVRTLRAQLEWFKKQIFGGGKARSWIVCKVNSPCLNCPLKQLR